MGRSMYEFGAVIERFKAEMETFGVKVGAIQVADDASERAVRGLLRITHATITGEVLEGNTIVRVCGVNVDWPSETAP